MFGVLFLKECKQTLKCSTYYIILACLLFFYMTQFGDIQMIKKPEPNQQDYGMTYSKDERVIMESTLQSMINEYVTNSYVTYPTGFYKEITLNEEKQSKIFDTMLKITGLEKEELKAALDKYSADSQATLDKLNLTVADDMKYERFMKLMKQADKLLGGGSKYSEANIRHNAYVSMTYEDALQEYNEIMQKDHLTGAYARLFCDYMGIILAILPVFLAVVRTLRDKRAGTSQTIYSKSASSINIVLSRYLSIVVMLMLPVLLIAAYATLECIYIGSSQGVKVDIFAFFNYSCFWLLPSVMISASVGILLTELTETAIAIVVMAIWWFTSLFMGAVDINGDYGWNLIPRHNSLGNYQLFHDNLGILLINRLSYAMLAILLAVATVWVYDLKRKGKLGFYGRKISNIKSKS